MPNQVKKGGLGFREFGGSTSLGGPGNNPFKIRKTRRYDMNDDKFIYGLPLTESNETELENHAWLLFRDPVSMNPPGIGETVIPKYTAPFFSNGQIFINKITNHRKDRRDRMTVSMKRPFQDIPRLWGWAPQKMGDVMQNELETDTTQRDQLEEILKDTIARVQNQGGGYKIKNKKKRPRKTRTNRIKKKGKQTRRTTN